MSSFDSLSVCLYATLYGHVIGLGAYIYAIIYVHSALQCCTVYLTIYVGVCIMLVDVVVCHAYSGITSLVV